MVVRNDKITIWEIEKLKPESIVISPGPATPLQAGISNEIIKHFSATVPILGVCLGHQCIGYCFGGKVALAKSVMHGKSSLIHHNDKGVFEGIPNPFSAIRYHSLMVYREGLPDCLEITAWTDDGTIMGLRHKQYQVEGIQFHPESFMTENGIKLLKNFINSSKVGV
jgi:anthranilate synthase component 2